MPKKQSGGSDKACQARGPGQKGSAIKTWLVYLLRRAAPWRKLLDERESVNEERTWGSRPGGGGIYHPKKKKSARRKYNVWTVERSIAEKQEERKVRGKEYVRERREK